MRSSNVAVAKWLVVMCMLAGAATTSTGAWAQDNPWYGMNQVLNRTSEKLIAKIKPQASWMPWVSDNTVSDDELVAVDGISYDFRSYCQPHQCSDNVLVVVFSRDETQGWAALVTNGSPAVLFGNPDATMAAALLKSVASN